MLKLSAMVAFEPPAMDWLIEQIALEQVGNEQLLGRLAELVDSWKRQCTDFLFAKQAVPKLKLSLSDVDKVLRKVNYLDVALMEVYVPVGLKASYLDTIEVLVSVQQQLSTIETRLLKPFYQWLAEVLARPPALGGLSTEQRFQFLDCPALNKTLDQLFDPASLSDRQTCQNVVARNSDWALVISQLASLIAQHNQLKMAVLEEAVKAIIERVDRLIPILKTESTQGNLSEASKMAFAKALYDIAQEVTLYTRLNFLITALRKAVHDSFGKLKALSRGR